MFIKASPTEYTYKDYSIINRKALGLSEIQQWWLVQDGEFLAEASTKKALIEVVISYES